MQKLHIVYVPGLADKLTYRFGQRTALFLWRGRRVVPHYFVANWANEHETYHQKLRRLLDYIDNLHGDVAIMGASAGASLALAAFAERKNRLVAAVSICGKLRNPQTVPKPLFALNKAFKSSIQAYELIEPTFTRYDRRRIATTRSWRDSYVPFDDGRIAYAHIIPLASVGHVFTIFMALTIYRHKIIRFIKRAEKL